MPSLSIRQVVVRILIVIAAAEFFIMLTLWVSGEGRLTLLSVLLDVVLLVVISTPLIYCWVISPFVKERDLALSQVSHLAFTDPLTQLANRRLLVQHLEKAIAGSIRNKIYGALLLIDLDKFKAINDKYGHDAGDAVLIEIAERLRTATRAGDTVCRMGGDEFVVLLNRLDKKATRASEHAVRIAEKLIELIQRPIPFKDQPLAISASIGMQLLGSETPNAEVLMAQADAAMYQAKQNKAGWALAAEVKTDKAKVLRSG